MDSFCREPEELPTLEELQDSARNSLFFHFIGLLKPLQPGVRLLFTLLEYEHYSPGTARYGLFKAAILEWNQKEWVVMSAPQEEAYLVHEVAFQCGLEVVPGVPHLKCPEEYDQFPIIGNGNNVFTLLNPPDHFLFSGKTAEIEAMFFKETFQVLALNQRWDRRN